MSTESDFYSRVAPAFVNEQAVRVATLSILAAHRDAKHWIDFERDTVPGLRRWNMLSGLMFSTWGRGVTARQVPHQGGTHVEVAGDGFVLTTVTRAKMPTKVEPHEYRETLARSGQLDLLNPELIESERFIYALLVFGGHFKRRLPSFCRIAFPTVSGELAPGTIDLMETCAHIVTQFDDVEYRERSLAEFIEMRDAAAGGA